jgi:hypothetical protein
MRRCCCNHSNHSNHSDSCERCEVLVCRGRRGRSGSPGPRGVAGPPGAPAPSLSSLSVFTKLNANKIVPDPGSTVPPLGTVPLDQTMSQTGSGIAPYTGTGIVTIVASGVYEITFQTAGFFDSVNAGIMALAVNGSTLNGSEYITYSSTAGYFGLFGPSTILALNSGNTVNIVNTDPTHNYNLSANPAGPPAALTGYLVIKQVS